MTRSNVLPRCVAVVLLGCCVLLPGAAGAHVGPGDMQGGFLAGFEHPISGLDHVVAMVAVGLWGAQLGRPAIWVLPVTFPLVMAFGGVLGGMGVPLPGVETGIAISALALGAMVALAARPPLWLAGVLVGIFAIFHGYAHGAELPRTADFMSYAVGFVLATGMLHLAGITVGTIERWQGGRYVLRTGGVLILACGAYFLAGALSA